ncbi:hypothetical protein FZEAL_10387 [Fusarium zealandicum]|uniref:Tubulin-specific chaperone A n=1 Tax=Fusarium zealandicum TaxID=1053134 RepID=A0A8H4U2B5_9HYPO|nr:hypothetical protein FZEAL_10387 [Fusarium zealandicum]
MPPPSQLAIATGSVNRLLKEEASYHKELEQQEAEVKGLKDKIASGGGDADGNATFMLKQQTKAVFEPLRQKIAAAVEKLEEQIAVTEGTGAQEQELQQAKEALAKAKAA